jgi:DNA-binding NarL/FixJ family response regulator
MRVLLADDHTRVRWALRTAIQEEPGIDVVGEVSEGHTLLAQIRALRPDVILLEWELSGWPASGVLTALRALDQPCRVVVLGQHPDARAAALAAGADAFVSKSDPPDKLLGTLRELVKG